MVPDYPAGPVDYSAGSRGDCGFLSGPVCPDTRTGLDPDGNGAVLNHPAKPDLQDPPTSFGDTYSLLDGSMTDRDLNDCSTQKIEVLLPSSLCKIEQSVEESTNPFLESYSARLFKHFGDLILLYPYDPGGGIFDGSNFLVLSYMDFSGLPIPSKISNLVFDSFTKKMIILASPATTTPDELVFDPDYNPTDKLQLEKCCGCAICDSGGCFSIVWETNTGWVFDTED